jgi:hypothetical protein
MSSLLLPHPPQFEIFPSVLCSQRPVVSAVRLIRESRGSIFPTVSPEFGNWSRRRKSERRIGEAEVEQRTYLDEQLMSCNIKSDLGNMKLCCKKKEW